MKYLSMLVLAISLSSCSSNQTSDYVVKERNPDPAPEWTKDFNKFQRDNEGKGLNFYHGESGDVSDRISGCDVAAMAARASISKEIAQLISAKAAQFKGGKLFIDPSNPQDEGMRTAFESQLSAKSVAMLTGTKEYARFWELRDYSKSNGRKRVYNCSVIVSISDKDLQQFFNNVAKKAPEVIEDAEAKAAVKDSLKDIDREFANYKSNKN